MYVSIYEKVIFALLKEFVTVGSVGAMGANLPLGTNTENAVSVDRTKDIKIKKKRRKNRKI